MLSGNQTVRVAPSPTGKLHLGVARTALINYAIGKKPGNKFIIRIEDTDLERSTKEYEESILNDLSWLGIKSDVVVERQSDRLHIYKEYVDKLLESGHAYICTLSQNEVEDISEKTKKTNSPVMFRSPCRDLHLTMDDVIEKDYVVRLRVDDGDPVTFEDSSCGHMKFSRNSIPEFVLIRSNGIPSYNFAVVIDDITMGVTAVIRGNDHLSNTPKQALLYRYLDKELPSYCHLPMINGPDGKKFSKRHYATSIAEFKDLGFIPEALINFMAMMSWSHPSGNEIFGIDDYIEEINMDRFNKSPYRFDIKKLEFLNKKHIMMLSDDDFYNRVVNNYINNRVLLNIPGSLLKKMVVSFKNKATLLSQVQEFVLNLIEIGDIEPSINLIKETGIKTDIINKIMSTILNVNSGDKLSSELFALCENSGYKTRDVFLVARLFLSNRKSGGDLKLFYDFHGKVVVDEIAKKWASVLEGRRE